jgi:hypothetical protein
MTSVPQVRQKTRQQVIWESMAGEEWAKQHAELYGCRSPARTFLTTVPDHDAVWHLRLRDGRVLTWRLARRSTSAALGKLHDT